MKNNILNNEILNINGQETYNDIFLSLIQHYFNTMNGKINYIYIVLIIYSLFIPILKLINYNIYFIIEYINIEHIINYSVLGLLFFFIILLYQLLNLLILDKLLKIKNNLNIIFENEKISEIIIDFFKVIIFLYSGYNIYTNKAEFSGYMIILGLGAIHYGTKKKFIENKINFIKKWFFITSTTLLVLFPIILLKTSNIVSYKLINSVNESYINKGELLYYSGNEYIFNIDGKIKVIPNSNIDYIDYEYYNFSNFIK